MWTPRLVALDLDGTVVAPDDTISDGLVAAVQDVVAAGVGVVIATGRGWHAVQHHVDRLGLPPGPHVTSNGAVLVSYPPFHLDEVVTFDASDIIPRIVAEHPQCLVAVEVIGQGYQVNRLFPEGELGGRVDVVSTDELIQQEATRVVVRDPDASDAEFIELAERLGLTGVSYSIGYTAWLDIAPEGVHKAMGLEHVVERLGLQRSDVLAIGDGRNDIEMLEWAGRGVALGEAPPEVQAAADHVTGLFSEDGTIAELRRWFPGVRAEGDA